jgi:hypothetical protein
MQLDLFDVSFEVKEQKTEIVEEIKEEKLEFYNEPRQQKLCLLCNQTKPSDSFYPHTNNCKVCRRKVDDERRQKGREYVFKHYATHPCVDCGEKNPCVLQLDHLVDKYKDVSKMVAGRTTVKTLKKEIEKCVVRCANCHAKKTARDQGWYKNYYNHDTGEITVDLTKTE